MSESGNGHADGRARSGNARSLASSGWMIVVLAGIVLWSWLIRVEPKAPPVTPARPERAPAEAAPPPGPVAAHPPEPTVRLEAGLEALASRAKVDVDRLRRAGAWTRQVGVYCSAETVATLLRSPSAAPSGSLHVLPVTLDDGRSCFRLCWGAYPDKNAAESAAIPGELLRGNVPTTRAVAEVLP